jgi:xylose isomerase
LFHAHIGGMDTMARALVVAADILEAGELDQRRNDRYAGWATATDITGGTTLQELHDAQLASDKEPARTSGHQEALENLVARHIERAR